MTITNIRNNETARRALSSARMLKGRVTDVVGAMQLKTGRPPTVIGTPRMALEQWKYAVRNVPEPRKGTLMLIATRNRRWVEWATFSACYLLQMGYRPILVYSSSEIDTLYSGESADCVVIVTNHATFDWQKVSKHARLIVDTRNALLNTSPAATVIRL